MNDEQKQVAQRCKQGAEENSMDFPEIVQQLMKAGFERYMVDFCRGTTTYYLPSGENMLLETFQKSTQIPEQFSKEDIQKAIKEAQMKVAGYTYQGFCEKAMAAGCIGYLVSFLGKRVVYFSRTGDFHVEYFPHSPS